MGTNFEMKMAALIMLKDKGEDLPAAEGKKGTFIRL